MDQYHFYDEIGKGRHSQVYKGRQKKTVEYVAIKRVDKSQMDRVVNEVQIMHRLSSPHTLKFHSWYETRNNLWLILEYCTGGDLLSLLKQDVRLPESAIKVFGVDLMTGLQYLHSSGILYCDLKPSNVLVDEYGVLKLSDFGLARRVPGASGRRETESKAPNKRGSPAYMAPELFLNDGVPSYKSELWSLGCVLHELAVGYPPFSSSSLNDILKQILYKEVTWPDEFEVSGDFKHLISRLLVRDPLLRCSWEEALSHSFWSTATPPQPELLPTEVLYEATIQSVQAQLRLHTRPLPKQNPAASVDRGATAAEDGAGAQAHGSALLEDSLGSTGGGVDFLRLSRNVQRNLAADPVSTSAPVTDRGGAVEPAAVSPSQALTAYPQGDDVALPNNDVELDFSDARPTSGARALKREDSDERKRGEPEAKADSNGRDELGDHQDLSEGLDQSHRSMRIRNVAGDPSSSRPASSQSARAGPSGSTGAGSGTPAAAMTRVADHRSGQHPGQAHPHAAVTGGLDARSGWYWERDIHRQIPVGDIMFNKKEFHVNPIILNKQIEVIEAPQLVPSALPFAPVPAAEVSGWSREMLEQFLTSIFGHLSNKGSFNDRMQLVSYLYTICHLESVADIVINSSFASLFLHMLRRMQSRESFRCLVVTLLGVLIRHANNIIYDVEMGQDGTPHPTDGGDAGLLPTLTELLRDPSPKIRRRAMATLGELLFYISSLEEGEEDEPSNGGGEARPASTWTMPAATVSAVARCLLEGEDETVCHYAAKTIENILAQAPGVYCRRFATEEVAVRLLDIATRGASPSSTASARSGADGSLRTTAACALSHLFRFLLVSPHTLPGPEAAAAALTDPEDSLSASLGTTGPKLVARVLGRGGPEPICRVIEGGVVGVVSEKMQLAFLNMLNCVLWEPGDGYGRGSGEDPILGLGADASPTTRALQPVREQFFSSRVVTSLVKSLDRQHSDLAKGKILLAIQLLSLRHPQALVDVLERNLIHRLDRIVAEQGLSERRYLRLSTLSLLGFLCRCVGTIPMALAQRIEQLAATQGNSPNSAAEAHRERDAGAAPARPSLGGLFPDRAVLAAVPALVHLVQSRLLIRAALGLAPSLLQDLSLCVTATVLPLNPTDGQAVLLDDTWVLLEEGKKRDPGSRRRGSGSRSIRPWLQTTLLLVVQGLARHAETELSPFSDKMASCLSPAVCRLLIDTSGDIRTQAVTLLRYLLPAVITTGVNQGNNHITISTTILHDLLPRCPDLVADRDPIPQFTLALLLDLAEAWNISDVPEDIPGDFFQLIGMSPAAQTGLESALAAGLRSESSQVRDQANQIRILCRK